MYYKLNSIKLISEESNPERFNILSEVVDSSISYECPIIVDSIRDLELWFGKSFKEHDFFCDVLKSGVSLYLYKPVKSPRASFLKDFTRTSEVAVKLPILVLPETGEPDAIYCLGKGHYIWNAFRWTKVETDWEQTGESTYRRPTSGGKYIEVNITKTISYIETIEPIATLDQIENCTTPEDRIGKIYELPDGSCYIWYEWIKVDDLKYLPDFDESAYLGEKVVAELPKITESNREELEKYIYKLRRNVNGTTEISRVVLFGDSTWTNEDFIPNVVDGTSESLENRDCLYITPDGNYTYPKYSPLQNQLLLGEDIPQSLPDVKINLSYDVDSVMSGKKSYVFEVVFPEIIQSDSYIVLPNNKQSGKLTLLHCSSNLDWVRRMVPESYAPGTRKFSSKKDFFNALKELGYTSIGNNKYVSTNLISCPDVSYFEGLSFSPSPEDSMYYINKKIESTSDGIEVWSRCIGKDSDGYDDSQYITFTIEEGTLSGYYRVIVEKYNISEIFEAPVFPKNPGDEYLEEKINKESKLIRCRLKSSKIKTGTYTLRGATVEENTPEMYLAGLNEMFWLQNHDVYSDFFLVPNPKKYGEALSGSIYKIYNTFLKLSEDYRLQVLIQNDLFDSNFKYNLLENKNQLLYFCSPIQIPYGKEYPGYYIFICEFLSGSYNDYALENIIYPKISLDPYENSNLENLLTKYKCNYLTLNNHQYYYKKYISGENYETSILRRFLIGKIYREIQKISRSLIGLRTRTEITDKIYSVTNKITNAYHVVDGISIVKCDLNLRKNKLVLKLESSLKELVEEDILLDITINYNENGNNSIAIS